MTSYFVYVLIPIVLGTTFGVLTWLAGWLAWLLMLPG